MVLKLFVLPAEEEGREIVWGEEVLFHELNSEALTGADVVAALAPIIDQRGWRILDKITAEGRSVQQMTVQSDKVKTRSERMAVITNGRNTIQLLDWEEKTSIVQHDPILRIVGTDAPSIAHTVGTGILRRLVDKLITIDYKKDVANDIVKLTGTDVKQLEAIRDDLKAEAENLVHSVVSDEKLGTITERKEDGIGKL